jgi:hypothetical protein
MRKKRIFVISIKYLEFCDQHHSQWTDDFRSTVGAGGQVARFSECERCHSRIGWSTAWLSGIPWFGWNDIALQAQ